ncbi:glycosyltransferase [Viridibacillus sp. YIM B01967]|uniref:Glycosyltransferase n=1 Tax=Viridibacillus soli TaxID=2798301 RepID=A0ABS1H868_9BACL|nr:glycosyltransferase [Viridibacillus soli]MBK3495595.1 glycosyltransferase [Viridibacillus soli]
MKKKLFMTVWDMAVEKGGINKVMLRRSSLFSNEQFESELLTFDYKPNYGEIEKELRQTGQLAANCKITNVYDYYRDKLSQSEMTSQQKAYYEKASKLYENDDYWVEAEDNYARYFLNGMYIKYKKWNDDRVIEFIDYFTDNRIRIRREEFHKDGYINRETFYHSSNNKKNQERYYTKDGFCYLNIWYNHIKGNQQRLFLFSPHYQKAQSFANRIEFHTAWLNEICNLEPVKPIVICDGAGTASRVIGMDDSLVEKVYMMHSNHFEAPYTLGSKYKENLNEIIEVIPKGYTTVVLTKAQQLDLHKEIGNRGNIHVIPNFVEVNDKEVEKDPLLVTMIARYSPEKRIDEAIHSFAKVVQNVPKAKLEVYGAGAEKEKLEELIKELKLTNNVFLKGYTNHVQDIVTKASVSLITSSDEGMSIALIESLASRTPVISYDINYGPSEIIENGVNGYVVPNGDKEQLAEKIIHLLNHPEEVATLGAAGQKLVATEYTPEGYYEKWHDLLHNLPELEVY